MRKFRRIFGLMFVIVSVPLANAKGLRCGEYLSNDRLYFAVEQAIKIVRPSSEDNDLKQAQKAITVPLFQTSARILHTVLSPNGVVIIPDIHGDVRTWIELILWLHKGWADGLAIELPEDLQPLIEIYQSAAEGSAEFAQAQEALRTYLSGSWDALFRARGWTYPESPIELVLKSAKRNGVRIVAMDSPDGHRLSREEPSDLIASSRIITRNLVWAKNIQNLSGRVLVFGGRGHFTMYDQNNVQDFIGPRPYAFVDPRD